MGSQLPRRGIAPTILGPCLLWPNDWIGQDATIGTEVILGPGDIVLDEDPVPPSKNGGTAPQPLPNFRTMYCGQSRASHVHLLCYRTRCPVFYVHGLSDVTLVYCGQRAGSIKMKRHGDTPWPRHILLYGDPGFTPQ